MKMILISFTKIWKKFNLKNPKFYRKAISPKKMLKRLNYCKRKWKKTWSGMRKIKKLSQLENKIIRAQALEIIIYLLKIIKVCIHLKTTKILLKIKLKFIIS